jgi:hypothetical protein
VVTDKTILSFCISQQKHRFVTMPLAVPIENGLQGSVLISSGVALALVATTVALRLLAKYQVRGWDAGDYCTLGAFVGTPTDEERPEEVTDKNCSWPILHCTPCSFYLSSMALLDSTWRTYTYALALTMPHSSSRYALSNHYDISAHNLAGDHGICDALERDGMLQ